MISMKALETLSGDISVYNDQVTYVLFEKLATIEGSVMFNASSLQSFEFPVLTTVGQDLNLQGLNEENTAAGSIASLEIPELTSVGGVLSVNNLAKLTSMSFLKLKETGGLDFHTVPVMLETINLPEIETVNGSIIMEANMEAPPTGSFVPQRNDVLQAFGGMDKLTTIKGQIKIKNFTALKQLSLGLASSGVTGALSGTDWNIFNGKFPTPTGLTTNYLPKWNGSGFGNSAWQEIGGRLTNGSDNGEDKLQVNGGGSFVGKLRVTGGGVSTSISNVASTVTQTISVANPATKLGIGYVAEDFPMIQSFNISNAPLPLSINPFGGNVGIGTSNVTDKLTVNGNISASPAVSPNQVVVKSQLDAVASSAGTWSSNCSSADNKLTGITTKDSNYLKVGSIVNCSISGSFTGYTTSESYTDIQGVLPFNSTVIQPTYLGAAVIHIPTTDEVIQAFIYTFGANGFRLRFKTPTGASKTGVFSVTFQYR
jgi:hypothetical protein